MVPVIRQKMDFSIFIFQWVCCIYFLCQDKIKLKASALLYLYSGKFIPY